jgi:succinate-semialdehyde dehydrogenase/glutarate-semialdehyde dehydrogenase
VNSVAWGGFANSGQICISVERVLVNRKIAGEFTKRLVEQVQKLRQGDPTMHPVDVGAMTFPKQVDNVEKLVEDARAKGAKVLTGGKRLPGPGRFYAPTLLSGVTPDMAIARQEIFGPAVPIIEVADDEEAIRIANDSHLGLNAYVFSKNRAKARRIAERVQSGTTAVNTVLETFAIAELPFGGVKESGLGRIHGAHGLLAMVESRGVNEPRFPALKRDLWMYPYDRRLAAFVQKRLPMVAKLLDAAGWLA